MGKADILATPAGGDRAADIKASDRQPPPKRKQREKQDPHVRAEEEAPFLRPRFQALRRLHTDGVLSAPDVCVAYILAYLQVRLPGRWLIGRREQPQSLTSEDDVLVGPPHESIQLSDPRLRDVVDPFTDRDWSKLKLASDATLFDLIAVGRFNQVPEHVAPCLFNFYAGRRPLVLLWHLPSAVELLEMQAAGRRCVSALVSERALCTMYGHRGCLEMLVHDLSHMECLVDAGRYWQQIGYFEFLRATVAPVHELRWTAAYGERWRLSWYYVSADMNAIANHMLQTLKWQLAVAVARSTLCAAGLRRPEDEAEDAALSTQHADVYPRASLADWEPALRSAGLMEAFEENFVAEWHDLLASHVSDVSSRFPGIFVADEVEAGTNAEELRLQFSSWPHPTAEAFLTASAYEVGRDAARLESTFRAKQAAAVIARFDELGRRHLGYDKASAVQIASAVRGDSLPSADHSPARVGSAASQRAAIQSVISNTPSETETLVMYYASSCTTNVDEQLGALPARSTTARCVQLEAASQMLSKAKMDNSAGMLALGPSTSKTPFSHHCLLQSFELLIDQLLVDQLMITTQPASSSQEIESDWLPLEAGWTALGDKLASLQTSGMAAISDHADVSAGTMLK